MLRSPPSDVLASIGSITGGRILNRDSAGHGCHDESLEYGLVGVYVRSSCHGGLAQARSQADPPRQDDFREGKIGARLTCEVASDKPPWRRQLLRTSQYPHPPHVARSGRPAKQPLKSHRKSSGAAFPSTQRRLFGQIAPRRRSHQVQDLRLDPSLGRS